jgi:hypothetical protein
MVHHCPPPQSASRLQPPAGRQVPSALHAPDRQRASALAVLQDPPPLAQPHALSVSQTLLEQTSAAACAVHAPLNVGLEWRGSEGTAVPLASFAVQACVLIRHHSPPLQSESRLQPPATTQVPPALQAPDRQRESAVEALQEPSPSAHPHALSASQTPLEQTRVPACAEQVPFSAGLT